MKQPKISIITTLYKGKGYIKALLSMAERNLVNLQKKYNKAVVEYVFVNDYPDDIIPPVKAVGINCIVINNAFNSGIHYSRVAGVGAASGDFILFLDQDDEISDDCLLFQYERIGENNVIVCNGYKELNGKQKKIYKDSLKFSLINDLNVYLKAANQIVSPGQCLIRKSSIPTAWKENVITINGSDDLFLWLLFLENKEKFIKNKCCLYTHKSTGLNLSADIKKMCDSDMYMLDLSLTHKFLTDKTIKKRRRLVSFLTDNSYSNKFNFFIWCKYIDIILIKMFAKLI